MKKYLNLFDFRQKVDYKTEVLSGAYRGHSPRSRSGGFCLHRGPLTAHGTLRCLCHGADHFHFRRSTRMISGATGAVAVVIVALSITHGAEYVFAAVILAGILQVLAGVFRLGKLMRLVPHPVIFGFVNGLAVIIFMPQIDQFKDPSGDWLTGSPLYVLLRLVLLTMLIIWGVPRITKAEE